MPALTNPRHEAFAQAIIAGLANADVEPFSRGRAYHKAGYSVTNRNSQDAAASRLLRLVKPITDRVAELQSTALARLEPKLDLSRERIGRRLDKASQLAERLDNPAAMATCELGLAKVFHSIRTDEQEQTTFKSAQSMHDIGKRLLQSFGVREPDDTLIAQAVEANDVFIDTLRRIAEQAQGLIVDAAAR